MPLPDFFRRSPKDPIAPSAGGAKRSKKGGPPHQNVSVDPAGVLALRAKVRRRLMGVAVLLAIGVVLFSFVLDRQPRPSLAEVPLVSGTVDKGAPEEGLRKAQGAVAPAQPAVDVPAQMQVQATASESKAMVSDAEKPLAEKPDSQALVAETSDATGQKSDPTAELKPSARPEVVAQAVEKKASSPEASKPEATKPEPTKGEPSVAKQGRFVVQVGAYTDPSKLREVRSKLTGMGLSNYTQVITNAEGPRTRVRIGPFTKKEEAQKVMERVKAAGLPTALLSL